MKPIQFPTPKPTPLNELYHQLEALTDEHIEAKEKEERVVDFDVRAAEILRDLKYWCGYMDAIKDIFNEEVR